MNWIKVRTHLISHPHVVRIASALCLPNVHVFGALVHLWAVADSHADGDLLKNMTPAALDRLTETPGLTAELVNVGWVTVKDNGLQLVNYQEHNGASAKRRALDGKRKKVVRIVSASCPQDVRIESRHHVDLEKEKEKEKEYKTEEPPLPPPGEVVSVPKFNPKLVSIPEALAVEAFKAAWESWCDYRTETRKGIKPRTAKAQLAELAGWGPEAAVQSINQSIRNGWTGLFPPNGGTATAPRPTRPAAPLASSTMDPKLAEEIFGIKPKPNGVHLLPEGPSNG